MIQCIIVEDTPTDSARLVKLLQKIDEPIKVLSICRNVESALNAINEHNPELVFLDINIDRQETAGFDLLGKVDNINFDIIFTTMYSDTDTAIKAIRACALDFLRKPFTLGELSDSIKLFHKNKETRIEQARTLRKNLQLENIEDKTVWIAGASAYTFIEVKNILYCKSDDPVTQFYLKTKIDGKDILTSSKSIGEWETDLEQFRIIRIHNRHLANLNHVVGYIKGDGGILKMSNGEQLDVSKGKKDSLLKHLGLK